MKKSSLFIALAILVLWIPSSVLTAQQTSETVAQTLGFGDEVTDTLEVGGSRRYILNIEDIDEAIDVTLFSTGDSVLSIYDDQGKRIRNVDRVGPDSIEVFTWEPGNRIPAQIEVSFYQNTEAGEYSLSILPIEPQVSEEPRAGEQVKRWAEFDAVESGRTRLVTVHYLLYVPQDYDESQQYPFILFLHGSGEAGTRLDLLKVQVIPKLIEEGEEYPFIIASPQLNYNESWDSKVDVLANFITHLESEFPIDPDRIYVTGLSLGGSGAWVFALRHPDVPAAVVPMAGSFALSSIVPRNICDLAEIPIWAFHGAQDDLVPLAYEQPLIDALIECGGNVQYTVYPDADHPQTFERGFADPALYAWLLEQHR